MIDEAYKHKDKRLVDGQLIVSTGEHKYVVCFNYIIRVIKDFGLFTISFPVKASELVVGENFEN